MAYKAEDIYFTLFNGLHGSAHGHASTGGFTLQLQGMTYFPIVVVTAMSTNQSDFS